MFSKTWLNLLNLLMVKPINSSASKKGGNMLSKTWLNLLNRESHR